MQHGTTPVRVYESAKRPGTESQLHLHTSQKVLQGSRIQEELPYAEMWLGAVENAGAARVTNEHFRITEMSAWMERRYWSKSSVCASRSGTRTHPIYELHRRIAAHVAISSFQSPLRMSRLKVQIGLCRFGHSY